MKNLFVSAILAAVLLTAKTASAERTYEKKTNVVRLVVKTKSGYELFFREWAKPVTTLVKTCNGVPTHECVYLIKGKREIFLYRYEAAELTFPLYKFEYPIVANN